MSNVSEEILRFVICSGSALSLTAAFSADLQGCSLKYVSVLNAHSHWVCIAKKIQKGEKE